MRYTPLASLTLSHLVQTAITGQSHPFDQSGSNRFFNLTAKPIVVKTPLLLLLFVFALSACESTDTIILPEIADQYISFKIDGQEQRLSSIGEDGRDRSFFIFAGNSDANSMALYRYSSDGRTALRLIADNLPVVEKPSGRVFDGDGFAPATMVVTSTSMSGSFYCPHEEVGDAVVYDILLRFDSWSEDGRMRGSFKANPDADNIVSITDGRFDLDINQE